jgi:uncharacterized membrane protein YgcG
MLKTTWMLLVAAFATTAYAQGTDCDSIVVDNAQVMKGAGARVENAAQKLINAGADVRIRTFNTMDGAANLDRFEKSIEAVCPSWTAPDGGMKNNLVVLMVAVKERKVGYYYGSQWGSVLSSRWTMIESNFMKPRFRDRDYVGGFVNSLDETTRLIEARTQAVVVVPSSPTPIEPPADLSGLWVVLGCLLVVVVVGALGWFVYNLIVQRNQVREERLRARQRAIIAQQGVASLMVQLDQDFSAFEADCSDKQRISKVKDILASASESFNRLNQMTSASPQSEVLSQSQYLEIAEPYESLLNDLKSAQRLMRNSSANSLPDLATATPDELEKRYQERHSRQRHSGRYSAPSPTYHETVVDHSTTIFAPVTYVPSVPSPQVEMAQTEPSSPSFDSSSPSIGGSADFGSSLSDSGGGSSDF